MSRIIDFFKQQIFPGFFAWRINNKLNEKYIEAEKADIDISLLKTDRKKYIKELKKELDFQFEMKEKIENKAKSLLFVIGVVIAALSFSSGFLASLINNGFKTCLIIIIILSVINLLFGVIRALQAINIKKFNIYQLEIKKVNGKYILQPSDRTDNVLRLLIKSKTLNDLINNKMSNYVYASYILIRNGIILFLIFFILSIIHS